MGRKPLHPLGTVHTAVSITPIERQLLFMLQKQWNCSRSEAVRRCIHIAFDVVRGEPQGEIGDGPAVKHSGV